MCPHKVIGVMGPGESAGNSDMDIAYTLGKLIARLGYSLLTGGRNCGVMEASMRGAKELGGITIGILPGASTENMSRYTDIPVLTGMGNARNAINILSSHLVIVVGEGAGTLSEVALAIKNKKPLIWLNYSEEAYGYFTKFQYPSLFFMDHRNIDKIEQLIIKLVNSL